MPPLIQALAKQARRPSGFFGKLFGFSMSRINRGANAWTLANLDLAKTDKVLEIGYGPGQAIELLCEQVPQGSISGIDFSETMLRQASVRNRAAIKTGLVKLTLGDAAKLHYPDASFDKVFCVNVVYFWENPEIQLREILRVLRPGGMLALYMGDSDEMAGVKITQTGVFNLYPAAALIKIFHDVGFSRCEYATTAISQGPLSKGVCVRAWK
jgi:ubiquinone/menaquinone biosynthesis C-methylase UbiE